MNSIKRLWKLLWQKHGGLVSFLIFVAIFGSFLAYNLNQGPENDRALALISIGIVQDIDKQNQNLITTSSNLPNEEKSYTTIKELIKNSIDSSKKFQSRIKSQTLLTKAGQDLANQTESFLTSNQQLLEGGVSKVFNDNAKILPTYITLSSFQKSVEELTTKNTLTGLSKALQTLIDYKQDQSDNSIDISRQGFLLIEIRENKKQIEKLNEVISRIPDNGNLTSEQSQEIQDTFKDKWPTIPSFPPIESKVLLNSDYLDSRKTIIDSVKRISATKK